MSRTIRKAAAMLRRQTARGGLARELARDLGLRLEPDRKTRQQRRRESIARQLPLMSEQHLAMLPLSDLPDDEGVLERWRTAREKQAKRHENKGIQTTDDQDYYSQTEPLTELEEKLKATRQADEIAQLVLDRTARPPRPIDPSIAKSIAEQLGGSPVQWMAQMGANARNEDGQKLSESDRWLLSAKPSDVMGDPTAAFKYAALQAGINPSSGRVIDLESEQAKVSDIERSIHSKRVRDASSRNNDRFQTEAKDARKRGVPSQSLSLDDSRLLTMTLDEAVTHPEQFRRYAAVHRGQDPESENPIDLPAERKRAKKREADQIAAAAVAANPAAVNRTARQRSTPATPARKGSGIDLMQLALGAAGIADPTPILDGANAAISVARAVRNPQRRGEHLANAAVSMASMAPYVGDATKLSRIPWAKRTLAAVGAAGQATGQSGAGAVMDRNVAANQASDEPVNRQGEGRVNAADVAIGGGPRSSDAPPPKQTAAAETAGSVNANTNVNIRVADAAGGSGSSGGGNFGGGGSDSFGPHPPDPPDGRRNSGTTAIIERIDETSLAVGAAATAALAGVVATQKAMSANQRVATTNRDLMGLDSGVTMAYVRSDIADYQRRIRRADGMGDAVGRSVDVQSEFNDLKERFTTPLGSIGSDVASSITDVFVSTGTVIDNVFGISTKLGYAAKAVGKFAEAIDWVTDRAVDFSGGDGSTPALGPGGKISDDAPAWQGFLDDIRDGKRDNKVETDPFFLNGFDE